MKLKDLNLKKGEVLEIGYFNNKGHECIEKGRYQVISGTAFETLKKNSPLIGVIKTKCGYASEFIARKKGLI